MGTRLKLAVYLLSCSAAATCAAALASSATAAAGAGAPSVSAAPSASAPSIGPSAASASPSASPATSPSARRPPPAIVEPGYALEFPRDHGAHPEFRTEWWYVTGWISTVAGETLGFQVTFFRTRPDAVDERNPSAFTPGQIVIAHAALSDRRLGHLWKAQRVARAGFGLAEARTGDTQVRLDGWKFERRGDFYLTQVAAEDFGFELQLDRRQPPMLNGRGGYSQKGPHRESASYYYSVPQLRVSGRIVRQGKGEDVTGDAWLDHEWSSAYLDEQATGWDWIGINLEDDGALQQLLVVELAARVDAQAVGQGVAHLDLSGNPARSLPRTRARRLAAPIRRAAPPARPNARRPRRSHRRSRSAARASHARRPADPRRNPGRRR